MRIVDNTLLEGYSYQEYLMDNKIWSTVPDDHENLDIVKDHFSRTGGWKPEIYHHLHETPWILKDLPGTSWRNLHTGSLKTIDDIKYDRFGTVNLPIGFSVKLKTLGIDSQEYIFIVEHWARVDHLHAKIQLMWHGFSISWLESQEREHSLEEENDWYKGWIDKNKEELDMTDLDLLNVGKKGQLSLL